MMSLIEPVNMTYQIQTITQTVMMNHKSNIASPYMYMEALIRISYSLYFNIIFVQKCATCSEIEHFPKGKQFMVNLLIIL